MTDEKNSVNETPETDETVEKPAESAAEIPVEDDSDKKKKKLRKLESDLAKTEKELEKSKADLSELNNKYVRMLAEYDNFRRRSAKEREGIYTDAFGDAVKEILPVLDNLERAVQYTDAEAVQKGVLMTLKSMTDMLAKLGITEVECKVFNPELHNAVMHVEDESLGEGEIVDVLQKGYVKDGKVIRYAMVKVAN